MIYGTQEFANRLLAVMKDGERHPLYTETTTHAEKMEVHICGEKPLYLLDRVRPREDADVKMYRIENYEPTTKAGADKAIDIVNKIFNPSLYSIIWPKENNPMLSEFQKYTMDYFPVYNSLVSYDKEVIVRKMLADPNALLAIRPERIPDNDVEELNPVNIIYSSENVWDYDLDHYLIYISERTVNSIVYYEFAYYDRNQYVSFEASYEAAKKTISIDELSSYQHNFNEIPAWFLRGKSVSVSNGMIYFESFFSSALPHWNLAVIHESDLIGAYINHMHPQKYELAEECNNSFQSDGITFKCRNGLMQSNTAHTMNGSSCSQCGGTGLSVVKSPYEAYQFNRKKLEEGSPTSYLPVGYIPIPTDATKMLEDRTREMNKKALWSINMDVEDSIGQNQSGVAKVIDRSAQSDTLFTIAGVVFDIHLTNQFYFINKYKNSVKAASQNKKEKDILPEVNKPVQFDILTTSELINNFAVAAKSGVDKNYLRLKAAEIAQKDFSTSPNVRLYITSMINLDPLYGFVQDEIALGVNSGVIRKTDWTIHENMKPFIDKAINEDMDFLKKDKSIQIMVLEKYAIELVKSEKPQIDTTVLGQQNNNQNDA